MIKLTIEYNSTNGHVLPDGEIEKYVDTLASYMRSNTAIPKKELISSVVILDTFRVAVKEGKLNHKEVIIRFEGKNYKLDTEGKISNWPKGLADVYDNILEKLL